DKGQLFVAAVNGRTSGGSAPSVPVESSPPSPSPSADIGRAPVPTVTVSTEITSIAVVDTAGGATSGAPLDRRTPKGAVYRIASDGLWDQLWESRDDSPYDITFDAENRLVVGTGSKGKLYRMEGDPPEPTLLARATAQQVTALYKDTSGRLYYA